MAWIEFHTGLWNHWKVNRLAKKLDISYPHALGLVSCLWTWAVDNAENGNLSHFTDEEIAKGCRWIGEASGFFSYLIECQLVDENKRIHDWDKHGIRILKEARRRKAESRERSRERDTGRD